MRWSVALALAAIAASTSQLAAGSASSAGRCSEAHSHTILRNSQLRVYTVPPGRGPRHFDVIACHTPTGKYLPLGSASGGQFPFLPPALAIRGSLVGYALEECDVEECDTVLFVRDIAHASSAQDLVNSGQGGPRGMRLVKVGSLRITAGGTLAWIACPEHHRSTVSGSQRPNCIRAGDSDLVLSESVDDREPRVLDRGRRISPRSLRLSGSRLCWKRSGHRRCRTLPS